MTPNEAKTLSRDVEASVVPVGTKVTYHGSHSYYHGDYIIQGHADREALKGAFREVDAYTDGVGYELWPVGVEPSYRDRDKSLHFVRRESITPKE